MASVYEILFSTYRILNFVGRDSFNTDLCLILLLGSALPLLPSHSPHKTYVLRCPGPLSYPPTRLFCGSLTHLQGHCYDYMMKTNIP